MKKRTPRKSMKDKRPVYDEQVNLLFPSDLCERARPVAKLLGVSVKQLFVDFCKTALTEHEEAGEATQNVYIDVEERELNAIIQELNQGAS